jgi:hypothetical protein
MRRSYWKFIGATTTLALLTASALPQSGPIGKRQGGGSNSGGSSGGGSRQTGGGSNSGGGRQTGGGSNNSGGGSRNDGGNRGGRGGDDGGSRNDGGSRSGGQSGGGQSGGGPIITFPGGQGGTRDVRQGGGSSSTGDNGGTRRRISSRSGRVNYGTNGNVYGMPEGTRSGSVRIERAPIIINNGQLQRRVGQSERNIGLVRDGYRYGYYHYRRDWRDDYFCYPYYSFDPFYYDRCVASPWYYYVSLPPYVNYSRVTIVNVFPTSNWYGTPYRWRPVDQWDRNGRYEDLDYSIEDIVDAFQDGSRRAIERLVPTRGTVNIYTEGNYSYSLNADDFYDLYNDGIQNVNTVRYQIIDVQRNRDGNARVLARHEFIDPWGTRQTVWHTYYLERDRRDYVIREFGTSYYRSGW